jgi:predicted Rossmann fold flavoprotein
VPLLVKDRMCHALQGQKLRARARAVVGGKDLGSAEGEILFTQYGLSGTAVIDVSEPLSAAINRDGRKDAILVVDFVPFLTESALTAEITRRLRGNWAVPDLVSGILPEKFGTVLSGLVSVRAGRPEDFARALASALKGKTFTVLGTRGWNEAEFTAGGVDAREIDPATLESARSKGVHFAGEILDVQGRRGGFNLAWAWASGYLAGEAAALKSAE